MYTVELDRSKRLLVISAARRVTAEEVNAVAGGAYASYCTMLRLGFAFS